MTRRKEIKQNTAVQNICLSSGIGLEVESFCHAIKSSLRLDAKVVAVDNTEIRTSVRLCGKFGMHGRNMHMLALDSLYDDGPQGVRLEEWAADDVEALRVALRMTEIDYDRFYNAIMITRQIVFDNPEKKP